MLNPKLEKQFNPHKLLTRLSVIVWWHACYVFLLKSLWGLRIFTKRVQIKAAEFHAKRSREPKENPPSIYKEMQVFWAKPSKSVCQVHNLVFKRMLSKLS